MVNYMPRKANKASINLLRQGKEINAKVHQICLFGSTNKTIINPIASFANLYHDNDLKKKVAELDNMSAKTRYEAVFLYLNKYYYPGIQPTSKEHRDLFIQETINSVATFSLLYGYGNCQPMADIAFLEAIFRDTPHDITYDNFLQKENQPKN